MLVFLSAGEADAGDGYVQKLLQLGNRFLLLAVLGNDIGNIAAVGPGFQNGLDNGVIGQTQLHNAVSPDSGKQGRCRLAVNDGVHTVLFKHGPGDLDSIAHNPYITYDFYPPPGRQPGILPGGSLWHRGK